MSKTSFTITYSNRDALAGRLLDVVLDAPAGSVLTVAEPGMTRPQQNKAQAMIRDIARQCIFAGRRWREESWKRLLVEAFVNVERRDALARGDVDPFPDLAMLVCGLDGETIVQLGQQTRTFTRRQAADFIESMYALGAEIDVTWSKKVDEMQQDEIH